MAYSAEVVRRARARLAQAKEDRESENRQHLAEAYAKVPRIREIDLELRRTMARAAQAAFLQGSDGRELLEQARQENLGLLFWGKPGNGKTFAAACIANGLLEQKSMVSVKMVTLGTVLNKLPGLSAQDRDWYLKSLHSCDLLILDDFGMERQTEYGREQVFSIVDGRYLSRKPLIVTTNLSLRELKSPADMARQRIYDRILELCVPVCFDRESLRQENARENMKRYLELTG